MKNLIVSYFALASFISLGTKAQSDCTLGVPEVTLNSVTACAISFSWTGDSQTSYYKVKYKVAQSAWQPAISVGSATSYTFTGLSANTEYVVKVVPYCSSSKSSIGGVLNMTTQPCSFPEGIATTGISDTAATVSWQVCGSSGNSQVRYRPSGILTWQNISVASSNSIMLSGLTESTIYEYEVNTCSDTNSWSVLDTFKTLSRVFWQPNILVIVLDDSRYDSYAPTGGPAFFRSPGINRIAEEGLRFEYAFPAYSICSPSRASIMTGLYPHHHGVIKNKIVNDFTSPVVSKILHDNGYYTGFTGKYGYAKISEEDGFDYWLESTTEPYWNSSYYYNSDKMVTLGGHKTDVITNKALEFLNSVPNGKRFLLYVNHKAPHSPYTPRTQDSGIYKDAPIPFPDNYVKWTENVPSQYYSCYDNIPDTAALKSELESYYELLAGAEASIDTILTFLENKGILDSTMVIFSSDNGYLFGEHMLDGKEIALEESIRIPMFIRYPKWFRAGTVVSDEMAMNIDIAPTMLEAAGIPDTFGMDGMSMHGLANHTTHRKELFYEYFYRLCKPTLTAVRDFNYKYVSSRCSNTVEEFYDLVNDPKENSNLINSPDLSELIQQYRDKLDSLKEVYGYELLEDTILPCSLENTTCSGTCDISTTKQITNISGGSACNDGKIKITPSGNFNAYIHLELYNNDSALVSSADPQSTTAPYTFKNLSPGTYYVKVFDHCCEFDLNDIKVKCPMPTGLFTSATTATSATVNWSNQGCNNGYKMQYREQGLSAWKTVNSAANVCSYNVTGLTANTVYEWKVSAKCASANPETNSAYSGLQTFTTSLRLDGSEGSVSDIGISIYPNPSSEMVTVTMNAKDAWLMQVQDLLGRILIEEKMSDENSTYKLNVAFLPAGTYLMTVRTASGILQTPFVKQ